MTPVKPVEARLACAAGPSVYRLRIWTCGTRKAQSISVNVYQLSRGGDTSRMRCWSFKNSSRHSTVGTPEMESLPRERQGLSALTEMDCTQGVPLRDEDVY